MWTGRGLALTVAGPGPPIFVSVAADEDVVAADPVLRVGKDGQSDDSWHGSSSDALRRTEEGDEQT
jgi:hypothetical protein